MITVSYKDGVWKHIEGFSNPDEAHAYAKGEGYTTYKLTKNNDRPMGLYTQTPDSMVDAPKQAKPKEPTPPTEPIYETPNTDEPNEDSDDETEIVEEHDIIDPTLTEPSPDDGEPVEGLLEELDIEYPEEDDE